MDKVLNTNLFKVMFFICLISIEYLATTTQTIEIIESMWDKSNHFIAFFVLYVLMFFGFIKINLQTRIYILVAFAFQIEVVQYFIEGRFFSFLDIIADCIGIVLGIIALKVSKLEFLKSKL